MSTSRPRALCNRFTPNVGFRKTTEARRALHEVLLRHSAVFDAMGVTKVNLRLLLRVCFVVTVSSLLACGGRLVDDSDRDAGGERLDGSQNSGPVSCPSSIPKPGTSCAAIGKCPYLLSSSACMFDDVAECKNGLWEFAIGTCAACPTLLPLHDQECDFVNRLTCYYSSNECATRTTGIASCVLGKWSVARYGCTLPLPAKDGG